MFETPSDSWAIRSSSDGDWSNPGSIAELAAALGLGGRCTEKGVCVISVVLTVKVNILNIVILVVKVVVLVVKVVKVVILVVSIVLVVSMVRSVLDIIFVVVHMVGSRGLQKRFCVALRT